jgi:hypothetical protein
MKLEQRLIRLERVAERRETGSALRTTDNVADPLTALLSVATIEELRRLGKVFESLRLRLPTSVQPQYFLRFATDDEVEELGKIFEVLERRRVAKGRRL